MKYYYRTSKQGKCGCKKYSSWFGIEANSKAEVKRWKKNYDNTVEVITEKEMQELKEQNASIKVYE